VVEFRMGEKGYEENQHRCTTLARGRAAMPFPRQ
jgi:hypothetical protein